MGSQSRGDRGGADQIRTGMLKHLTNTQTGKICQFWVGFRTSLRREPSLRENMRGDAREVGVFFGGVFFGGGFF